MPAALAAEYGLRLAGELKAAARQPAPASSRHLLPVTPDVSGLLPYGGLSTVTALSAARAGATSLLWRLLAGPSQEGAWCAVVGLPGLYPLAARSAGVDLDRLALVEADRGQIPDAAGALAAGVPVLVVPSAAFTPKQMRRLTAKSHRSGAAVVWWETRAVDAADARLEVAAVHWQGLRAGSGRRYGMGRLTGCELEVAARWRTGGKHRARIRPYGGTLPDNVVDLGIRAHG